MKIYLIVSKNNHFDFFEYSLVGITSPYSTLRKSELRNMLAFVFTMAFLYVNMHLDHDY